MSEQSYSRVPEAVDAWRMVAARREFEGRIPLATMVRLRDSLLQPEGDARYVLAFGIDALKVPFAESRVWVHVQTLSATRTIPGVLFQELWDPGTAMPE